MASAAEHFNSPPVRPGRRSGNSAKHSVSCPVEDCDRCRALAGVRNLCLDNLNAGRPDLHCTFGDETSGRVDRRQHAVDVPVSK
jgi:hypothetical protein